MHVHRNGEPPQRPPAHESVEYRAQQLVILELVVCPPASGDRLCKLIDRLELPAPHIEPAVTALERAGLAQRDGDVVRASHAALYFEHLWRLNP